MYLIVNLKETKDHQNLIICRRYYLCVRIESFLISYLIRTLSQPFTVPNLGQKIDFGKLSWRLIRLLCMACDQKSINLNLEYLTNVAFGLWYSETRNRRWLNFYNGISDGCCHLVKMLICSIDEVKTNKTAAAWKMWRFVVFTALGATRSVGGFESSFTFRLFSEVWEF